MGPAQPTSGTAQDLVAAIRDFGKVAMLMEMTYPDDPEPTASWALLREDPDGSQHAAEEASWPRPDIEQFYKRQIPVLPPGSTISKS